MSSTHSLFSERRERSSRPGESYWTALAPRDQHRLALHAALTVAGIPPRPEDRDAIDQLSALPSSINATLQRGLLHTA
ncbi:hypothetical protein [Streptomyces canus]|uniref:hypothetical protein n=1 Tax=Streptomyces canus TaxID=58343 RepID=UPI00324DF268